MSLVTDRMGRMGRRRVDDIMSYVNERISVDDNGCWNWTAARWAQGYGVIQLKNWRGSAHRVVYTELRGEIPEGLHLDHLCRNPPCCNPEHLEPVTQQENLRRGHFANKGRNYSVFYDNGKDIWTAAAALPRGEDGRRRAKTISSKSRSRAIERMEEYLSQGRASVQR